jgi:hypothetical protein
MRLCGRRLERPNDTPVPTSMFGTDELCENEQCLFAVHILHIEDWL